MAFEARSTTMLRAPGPSSWSATSNTVSVAGVGPGVGVNVGSAVGAGVAVAVGVAVRVGDGVWATAVGEALATLSGASRSVSSSSAITTSAALLKPASVAASSASRGARRGCARASAGAAGPGCSSMRTQRPSRRRRSSASPRTSVALASGVSAASE